MLKQTTNQIQWLDLGIQNDHTTEVRKSRAEEYKACQRSKGIVCPEGGDRVINGGAQELVG
ncbi:unnamed protein product [Fusarium graminearum]|uniref:Chromosome 2, complete genome n=1 Tax=Gibberella zeae (strain ATCC MYA-4620 / CBS 123657 / FGSC 9075 / NRRL 31084 / PH-1) TaxID=229533 RepID=A0A098DEA3_GIBZE|nr:unnamed protein product [Fusarium graminearum]CZS79567.1 unnamed protein product [Fusarium graminearum]